MVCRLRTSPVPTRDMPMLSRRTSWQGRWRVGPTSNCRRTTTLCCQCRVHWQRCLPRSIDSSDGRFNETDTSRREAIDVLFGSETSQTVLGAGRKKYHRAKGQVCAKRRPLPAPQKTLPEPLWSRSTRRDDRAARREQRSSGSLNPLGHEPPN
jgi:hypothetical protein